jgi:RHS repeat-associated protein
MATLSVAVSDTEAVYLYGLGILAHQQAERQYYFHDGLGSVRQMLDSTGQVQTNYAYDPFGVPVVAGDGSNPYQFTGEAWDGEVELLYLRARYYQPETGRFITKDPWAGSVWQPSTLNRYVYVRNDPVNSIDLGGLNGGGGPGGICPECKELMHPYEPSGVPGPGRGPLCPECPDGLPTYNIVDPCAPMLETLGKEYHIHVLNPTAWQLIELTTVLEAVQDLARLMGGSARFRSAMLLVGISKVPLNISSAAWAIPARGFMRVLYFEGASWGDPPELKWQTVHELAHIWDMTKGFRLSNGLMQATGSKYRNGVCQVPFLGEYLAAEWLKDRPPPLNALEDWADSVATYVYPDYAESIPAYRYGPRLISPARWKSVRDQMGVKLRYPVDWIRCFYEPDELLLGFMLPPCRWRLP